MKKIFIAMCLLLNLTVVFAKSAPDLVEKRMKLEKRAAANPFLISFYKPNYILPFYYNFTTPYLPLGNTIVPDGQNLNNTEFNFQLSFKVPLWREIAGLPSSLYLAYTQSSFWQSYGNSPFFRETNYEPELFLANNFNYALAAGWHILKIAACTINLTKLYIIPAIEQKIPIIGDMIIQFANNG
jgi:outer membrane phospholipase A